MNIEDENLRWHKLEDARHTPQGLTAIKNAIKEELARMKRILNSMHNPQERWNFICDNTSDTQTGLLLCGLLIEWCKTTRVGITKPEFEEVR